MLDYSKAFDLARDLYADFSYKNKLGHALMPLRYFFELTYNCNLNCPYCYVGKERKKDELTTEEWFKIIDQIPWYSFVTLVGGEPLIRKDFISILRKTAKKTLGKMNVVTNGTLINEEIIDEFIKNKMMLLSVSLDGFEKTHDINRNKEGCFDKVISNLDLLNIKKNQVKKGKRYVKSKYPMVDIKTIVMDNNLDDLPRLYELCKEMNFDFLSISFLRNNDLKQNSILRETLSDEFTVQKYPIKPYFDMEHFKEVYKKLEDMSKHSKVKIRFSPKFEDSKNPLAKIEEFFNYSEDKPIQEIYKPCKFPFSNVFITPEGNIYPCLSVNMGNVRDKSIKETFNVPKYCCFRKNLYYSKVFEACQMCCELKLK